FAVLDEADFTGALEHIRRRGRESTSDLDAHTGAQTRGSAIIGPNGGGLPMTARLFLLLLLIPSLSSAQTVTGTLQGTVKDQSGGVLPGTTISARSRDTGQVRETVTNGAGYYVLSFLPIGGYEVSAVLAGFKTVVHQQVAITLNDTRVVNFELAPAPVAETVTVRAEAP